VNFASAPRKLRVLMSADSIGGVFSYALELGRGLCAAGVEVAIATMGAPLSRDQRAALAGIPGLVVFESEFALEWMPEPWQSVDAAGRWLLRVAEQFAPDVVHLNGYSHAYLPWAAKTLVVGHSCVVSWWRAVRGGEPTAEYAHYRERVENGLSAADLVVAPSAAMLTELRACYRFDAPARVIHNGVTPPLSVVGSKRPFFLAAGRLWDEAKNLRLVAEVAPELPWRTLLAGEPPAQVPESRSVQLLGKLPRDRVLAWMTASGAFLHPARYEPFGLAPLEAALCETPLVLGNIPSLREIWGDAALYVAPNDASALLRVARSLARDREQRREFGRRARIRARRYSAERMVQQYLGAYRELIGAEMVSTRTASRAAAASALISQEAS